MGLYGETKFIIRYAETSLLKIYLDKHLDVFKWGFDEK